MDSSLPPHLSELIDHFSRLPSIGQKTATRLVFSLLKSSPATLEAFGKSLINLPENIKYCQECFHFAEEDICSICNDHKRDTHQICILENTMDLLSLERTHSYRGKYFVLGGVLSPIEGIGPKEIRIPELKEKFASNTEITEVIFALPATLEGEATANMISKVLEEYPQINISRIARGIPIGSQIQYADERTLARAFEGRQQY